jgi:hypothetical protein
VRNAVVVIVDVNMIVDADAAQAPFSEHVRLDRQAPERRPIEFFQELPARYAEPTIGCSEATPHVLQVFALSRSAAGGVGCSNETGSDAGKVSFRASSSAASRCLRSRRARALSF